MSAPDPAPAVSTWHQAVLVATRWLRAAGHEDAVQVPGGDETGVDVRAATALALVRYGEKAVRREHLQRLVDARGDDSTVALYAFTSSRFELPAVTFADARGIRLMSYAADGTVAPFDYDAALRSAGTAAGIVPATSDAIIRYAPLGIGLFMLVAAAVQFLGLVRGTGSGSWAGALISLGIGTALVLGWVALRRRTRANGAGGAAGGSRGGPATPSA